ncbi:unnamed protein product [Closterium sp. Yama58-4]|nr:unnamed protein product [Closterium sp. Yama58-4]
MIASVFAYSPAIVDVVDLLPGPIWHIIFRHLLLGSSSGASQEGGAGSASGASLLSRLKKKLQRVGNSSGASQEGAGSTSPGATGSGLLSRLIKKLQNWGNSSGASQEGGAGDASFGSCWPLLRCAMVCKRLLHHVASFPEFDPMKLTINPQDPALTRLSGTLSLFLRHAPHTPLNVVLNSPQDLHCLGRLLGPSARSLTTVSLGLKEPYDSFRLLESERLMHSAFLGEFEQLQMLELGYGTWQLGSLNPAMFQALRSLSIHDFERGRNVLPFLSSIAPQLHELALACSTHGSGSTSTTLDFKFTAARSITVCFENQPLHLRFALPASLKSFSATAGCLHVDCTCNSRLSLDSLSLIGRSQLVVSSLPLAAAKSVYLNGGNQKYQWRAFPCSNLESQRALTNLLSSIAPTVEELVLSHGDEVLKRIQALKLPASSDAEKHHDDSSSDDHEIVDVVDLLPGPIWHIIFCLLLLPSSHQGRRPWRGARLLNRLKNKLRNLGNTSPRASQQGGGEGSASPVATGTRNRLLSRLKNKLQNLGNSAGASQQGGAGNASITEEQHAEALRTFGSCWPLLRCAMVCKRLLYHVASFFVSHHHALPFPLPPSSSPFPLPPSPFLLPPSPFPLPTTYFSFPHSAHLSLYHLAAFFSPGVTIGAAYLGSVVPSSAIVSHNGIPPHNLYSHNLYSHNLYSHNLYSHNLYSHNLYSHNLYSHNLYSHNLYSHNLYSHNLYSHNLYSHNLLGHAMDLEPMTLPINPQDPATLTPPSGTLSVFLRHAPHTPLNLELNSSHEIHHLGLLLQPSARSLASLGLGIKEPLGGIEPIIKERHLMNPAFLEEFEQLQRLKLGRGTWQLGSLNSARFRGLRSLSIHDFVCDGNALSFLASLTPHLRELALASSSHVLPFALDFKFTAARTITLCFEKQAIHLRCALPVSLKAFSATAACLNVDCTSSSSPPSLDSLSLVAYSQLLVSSLPLAAAKSVYLNGASTRANRWRVFPCSETDSQRALTHLLSSIAPTVETLVLRYGWPLEGVRVEWSRLRHLSVGVNRYCTGGFSYSEKPEDPEDSRFWRFFGGEEGSIIGSSSSSSSSDLFIDAPNLESIYYATEEWQPGIPDALRRQFPSLASYRIVDPAFRWRSSDSGGERSGVIRSDWRGRLVWEHSMS